LDYPVSLNILQAAPRITLSFAAFLAVSGCARMYDGSIVPEYTSEMVPGGMVPRIEYRKTDVLPPSRLLEFPPAPPPPESEKPAPVVRAAPPRKRGGLIPKIPAELPRNVHCRNEAAADGRIRVVCL
jgi:hypothetical protein